MPAFNAATTIGAAISSVLWQTYRDLEVVVVDDGSTDSTAEIAGAFGEQVRVVSQENGGVGAARNTGIDAAKGELIAFLDADDVAFADHVAALVGLFDAHGGVVTANAFWLYPAGIDARRTRFKGRFPAAETQRRAILEQNFVSTMSLFRGELVQEIGAFDQTMTHAEDWDFWLRAIYAGHRVTLQPRPLALYRWGSASLSSAYEHMDASVASIFARVQLRDDLSPSERAYVARRLGGEEPRVLSREGDKALRAGRYAEAARLYRRAASMCPSERMLVWKARAISAAPRLIGPRVRARQLRIEQATGFDESFVR
jgi:glycosyltransferase involved in cell wall biosynthesis